MALRVDQQLCSGCGDCVAVCAVEALSVVENVVVVQQDECIECSACVDVCPSGALSLDDELPEPAEPSAETAARP